MGNGQVKLMVAPQARSDGLECATLMWSMLNLLAN